MADTDDMLHEGDMKDELAAQREAEARRMELGTSQQDKDAKDNQQSMDKTDGQ